MVGRVEVDIHVVVAAEHVGKARVLAREVVTSTEADDLAEQRRVAKRDVHGVISADAASVSDELGIGIEGPRERKHFAQDVLLEPMMAGDPFPRSDSEGIEAFGIVAIDAEELKVPGFHAVANGVDNAPALVVEKPALPRGEYQDAIARVPEYEQLHVAIQAVTKPLVVLSVHVSLGIAAACYMMAVAR
jgi:hypothetical protein